MIFLCVLCGSAVLFFIRVIGMPGRGADGQEFEGLVAVVEDLVGLAGQDQAGLTGSEEKGLAVDFHAGATMQDVVALFADLVMVRQGGFARGDDDMSQAVQFGAAMSRCEADHLVDRLAVRALNGLVDLGFAEDRGSGEFVHGGSVRRIEWDVNWWRKEDRQGRWTKDRLRPRSIIRRR